MKRLAFKELMMGREIWEKMSEPASRQP